MTRRLGRRHKNRVALTAGSACGLWGFGPIELAGSEGHHLGLAGLAVVLSAEADLTVSEGDQAAVADRHAVGVAGEVGQHLPCTVPRSMVTDPP